jgi:nitronate monooxygenase
LKSFSIGDLKIPVPIIQGGMGIGISMSGLASAVANMGGVGVIATVGMGLVGHSTETNMKKRNIDALRNEIRAAREKSKGIIAVNIMNVLTDYAEMVEASVDEGIDIIISGAGLPLDLPKYLKEGSKTKLVPIVSSGRAAALICNKWKNNFDYLPDAFVVEGPMAGGHLGFKHNMIEDPSVRLEELIVEVVAVAADMKQKYDKEIPVIAAGGIFNGNDMYQIMKLGATAVQLGTRFAATVECDASDEFKETFVKATESDITIIKSPVGLPGRSFTNQFLEEANDGQRMPHGRCKYHCITSCDPKTTLYCITDALVSAQRGDLNNGFVFTGSNGHRIERIMTVKEVFDEFISDYALAEKEDSANKA